MHSFIISCKNKKTSLEFVVSECKKNKIDKLDTTSLSFEKAVGIEDVRQIQKKLVLKPIKGKVKAVILDSFNGITIEAQNALLKSLEEPPFSTIIYILVPNKELLLPTILSRCKIVELKEKDTLSEEESTQYHSLFISLSQKSVGERLKLAEDLSKNKADLTIWLEKMIIVARQRLIERIRHNEEISHYLNFLISLNKAYKIISTTNANQRLVLENLLLNL